MRINDQIITRSEYEARETQLLQEAQQNNTPTAELQRRSARPAARHDRPAAAASKGKELGITGDAETMRQLDDIRKRTTWTSMEDLQKAATQQGVASRISSRHPQQHHPQQVVRDEVGRRLNIDRTRSRRSTTPIAGLRGSGAGAPQRNPDPHTRQPSDARSPQAQAKADDIAAKLKAGANFADLAKSSSGGPTAAAGGDLGDFKRGALGDVLENATFPLAPGATAPIRTRQGFVILHVDSHQAAGVPPLAAIEGAGAGGHVLDQLQPALRAYLTKAREDAYMEIDPGFVDTGSSHKQTRPVDIAYTAYKAPALKKKTQVKQRLEQEKANRAQADLAAARERVAEKQAEKAAQNSSRAGVKNVSMPLKPKKIRREKIRFGQAPQKSLPAGASVADVTVGAPLGGQAPGAAMAPTKSVTSITTGTGVDSDADPLAANAGPQKKTRFAAHQSDAEEATAKARLVRAEAKATVRPIAAAPVEDATEKHQATPLGLNGDTTKKQKPPKRKKGEAKERLQEKPKTARTLPWLSLPPSIPTSPRRPQRRLLHRALPHPHPRRHRSSLASPSDKPRGAGLLRLSWEKQILRCANDDKLSRMREG